MDLEQSARRAELYAVQLRADLRAEMETVALTGTAMVVQRVSETGKDVTGGAFKPYTKEYEAFKRGAVSTAKKEGAKKKAARKTATATADKPVGRFKGFVDFTLSGQMLSSVGLIETTENDGVVKVIVGGRDEETRGKMQGNDNYRKGWFNLSKDERLELAAQSQARLTQKAQDFLTA